MAADFAIALSTGRVNLILDPPLLNDLNNFLNRSKIKIAISDGNRVTNIGGSSSRLVSSIVQMHLEFLLDFVDNKYTYRTCLFIILCNSEIRM